MKELEQLNYPDVFFGKNVVIEGDTINIGKGVIIGDDVTIIASNIQIGNDVKIEYGTTVKGLNSIMSDFILGDNSLIGFRNQILTPYFSMNDYSQLHNSCLCSGYKPLKIGYNCWIGQGAILNCFDELTLGNNVRMGGSQIWTHVASGELLEGSNFYGSKPVVVKDNVWLMGFGHLITPGVTLAEYSVIMAGSVVSKDTEPYRTYSGIPAKDVSDKLPAWKKMSFCEKEEMIERFISEFTIQFPQYINSIKFLKFDTMEEIISSITNSLDECLFVCKKADLELLKDFKGSFFDVSTKTYLKRRFQIEIDWIKFNIGFRARFIPYQ